MTVKFFKIPFFALALLLFFAVDSVNAQDPNLANQYYNNGEYAKSAALYEELLEKDSRNEQYFNRLVESLEGTENYDLCEKVIKKQLKKYPNEANNYMVYGAYLEKRDKDADANTQYQKAIDNMASDFNAVNRLANAFLATNKYDFAIQTYKKGSDIFKDQNRFAFYLGELYRKKGDSQLMVTNYLNAIEGDPSMLQMIQTIFQRSLNDAEFDELQSQLYERVQKSGENPDFIELLAWSFIQKKDYKNALRQMKALDKRLNENGFRVFKLAGDANNDRDYDAAIGGYEYILTEKPSTSTFYFDSKRFLMDCRRKKITDGYNYSKADLLTLEAEYEAFLTQYPPSRQTVSIVLQLADLEALYLNNLDKAVQLLENIINTPGIDNINKAQAKIKLADFYLIKGEIWESTLLYSQVDKEHKEEQLGQEARFKNAKLSYFNGDFLWSQAQFDVLKASTSKLIANDALDLSVFITDNLVEDTLGLALTYYAQAEMLVFQNKFEEAFAKLDTIKSDFPEHALQDDLLYLEAQIYAKRQNWEKAAELYQEVATKYPTDIRADNSLYALAQIYETHLNNKDKAKELYEKIYTEFSGSVFSVDARKKYRVLRGDKVQ